jgi:hypothetical protein
MHFHALKSLNKIVLKKFQVAFSINYVNVMQYIITYRYLKLLHFFMMPLYIFLNILFISWWQSCF